MIFFVDNYLVLAIFCLCHLLAMLIFKIKLGEATQNIFKLLPFILLTVVINWLLSNYQYAFLVGVKLLLVCNITYIYAKTTTVGQIAKTVKNLCMPLKLFKIDLEDIEVLVCISLSMIPILKKEYQQLKEACMAKGMKINVKNMRAILAKFMISVMKRVNKIEEAMLEKGYGEG